MVRTAPGAHWLQIQIVAGVNGFFICTPLLILCNMLLFQSEMISGSSDEDALSENGQSIGLMMLSGLLGFAGMALNVVGYQIGDATKVASMEYLDLIYAFIFQWFMFGDIPNVYEWIGLICLLSTCALHFVEEWHNYKEAKRLELCASDNIAGSV